MEDENKAFLDGKMNVDELIKDRRMSVITQRKIMKVRED
jgi:hypothetical protein